MDFIFGSPDPPNPIATAGAQTGTNVSTAIANNALQQVNQVTPEGNLTYNQSGEYCWTDTRRTGQTYNIPQTTATQKLSPAGLATIAQSQQGQFNLARSQITKPRRLYNEFATPFSPLALHHWRRQTS